MTPRRKLPVMPRIHGALLLIAVVLCSATTLPAEELVRAVFQPKNDARGFSWNVDRAGRLSTQGNTIHANHLSINNGMFNARDRKMTKDGFEFVLSGQANGVDVTRRLRVHPKEDVVRVVDIVFNNGNTDRAFELQLRTQFSMPATAIMTDLGKTAGGVLESKASGCFATMQGQMAGMLFHLASPRARLRPTVSTRNNAYEFQASYKITVPAASSVAIVHGVSQSHFQETPQPRQLRRLFRPSSSRKFVKDLPQSVQKVFVNFRGGSQLDLDGAPGAASVAEELGVELLDIDVLKFKEGTRMHGTISWDELFIDTAFGSVEIPLSNAAAIVGESAGGGVGLVYLRTGDRLAGALRGEGVRFLMNSGLSLDLEVKSIDQLVVRQSSDPIPPPGRDELFVETYRGDRFLVSAADRSLTFSAPWGTARVPLAEVRRILPLDDEQPGHWVQLHDGNSWRVFLGGPGAAPLELESARFGDVSLHPYEIHGAFVARGRPGEREDEADLDLVRPHAVLAGGDVIVGPIDVEALDFLSSGGVIPVPPGQVKLLEALDGTGAAGGRPRFHAEIWGGGVITGELKQASLPFRTAAGVIAVPVRDIMEVHVPTPRIAGEMRARIAEMIRELGADEWKRREAATRQLEALGDLARLPIQEALRQASDPEVRLRLERILERLGD